MEGDEEEQIDTRTDRKKNRYYNEKAQIEHDRAATAGQIFADPAELAEKVNQAQRNQRMLKKGEQKGHLEDMFDADEIDDQYATKQDRQIAATDIPERL